VIGGVLVGAWSWRAVFFLNLPFAVGALLAAPRLAPVTRPRPRGVDLGGQVLAVAGLGVLTAALVAAGRLGWAAPVVLAGFAVSAGAWAAFIAVEHRGADPMLPLPLFARRGFRTGTLVGFLINLGFYGQLFVMSLCFQDVRGYSALRTGLALLPEAALLTIASAASGRLMARTRAAGADADGPAGRRRGPDRAGGGRAAHPVPDARIAHDRRGLGDGADHACRHLGGGGVGSRGPRRHRLRRRQRRPAGRRGAGRGRPRLVSVRATFIGGLRAGLIVAGCAFLAGAALVSRSLTEG